MKRSSPCRVWFLAGALMLGWGGPAGAQGVLSGLVTPTTPSTPGSYVQQPPTIQDSNTYVSFIDNALPRTQVRVYFDDASRDRRPTMAEFFQPKGGLPNSPGPPLPESNVDYQQMVNYVEVALFPTFSTFATTPLRWVNADANRDVGGLGDVDLGFKWAFWATPEFTSTFQFRTYVPTATNPALGTRHVSIEPALLVNCSLLESLTLEGEARFWTSIGGTDFAGDLARYGLGLSYGQRSPGLWFAPVVETVGWTLIDGKTLVPAPTPFVEGVAGKTIVNLDGGIRLGYGYQFSLYAGYGRALTGTNWYKDIWRIELRFFF